MDIDLTPDLLASLAELAGIDIPADDVELLSVVLGNQLALNARLTALDLSDVPPIVTMDPRWT